MLTSFLFLIAFPCVFAADVALPSCGPELKLVDQTFVQAGVTYSKLVVDGSDPIEIAFSISPDVQIKKLKWKLNGGPIDVDEDETKSAVYWTRQNSFIKLVIKHPKQQFVGDWEMILIPEDGGPDKTDACQLTSPPMILRFMETFRATEGHSLVAECKSASVPAPTGVQWFRAQGTGDNVVLTPIKDTNTTTIPGDTLVFKEVRKGDSGVYICNTTGGAGGLFDSAAAVVKVKSRFAALWPFIGILAELIILVVTIIVYERHKAAKSRKTAESDPLLSGGGGAPASGDVKSSGGGHHRNDNVRV